MEGDDAERWEGLCAQAAVEQDSDKLMALIEEINRLLEKKAKRLRPQNSNSQ